MLFSKLDKNSKTSTSIVVDKPVIFHFVPDLNSNILDFIDNMNINLNNVQGILIKSELLKLSSSFINTRNYLNELRLGIQDHRNITIYNITPSNIKSGKFLIYDHSPIVNLISMYNDVNIKQSTEFLLHHIKNTNIDLKLKFPTHENVPIFYLNSPNGILRNLKFLKRIKDLSFFDKFSWVSVEDIILNLGFFNNGKPEINLLNLSNIEGRLKRVKMSLNPIIKNNISKRVEVTPNIETDKLDVNVEKLSQSLNGLNISDKTVISNFKEAISKKLNSNNISDDNISSEILKSANSVIFNRKDIKPIYKDNPNKLLVKLDNVNSFKTELTFPKSKDIRLSNPEDSVRIREITGPVRHNYEFNENIDFNVEKLFKVLEYKQNPVKILNLTKEIKDNDLERYSEYSIELKNLGDKGMKGSYTINLKMPSLINDKYFKLNGKEYIISTQQFLNPITKDKPNEVRFLTHYNMIRLKLKNVKYNPSEIEFILELISNKYSKYVSRYENGVMLFKNGTTIDLNNSDGVIYKNGINPNEDDYTEVKLTNGKYIIFQNKKSTGIDVQKNEYLFDRLHSIIPELNLKIANKSVQYIQCYVMGNWLPLIVYFWQQLGLIESLSRFNLDYEFGEEPNPKFKNYIKLPLADTFLFVYPENKKEEYVANGLLLLKNYLLNIRKDELSSNESCYEYLYHEFGGSSISKFNGAAENMIDPITHDLLEFEDEPTNLLDNLSGPCIDKLLNDTPDHPSDLNSLRARQSEYLMNLLYNEIDLISLRP
jgi:hypothetical protein